MEVSHNRNISRGIKIMNQSYMLRGICLGTSFFFFFFYKANTWFQHSSSCFLLEWDKNYFEHVDFIVVEKLSFMQW